MIDGYMNLNPICHQRYWYEETWKNTEKIRECKLKVTQRTIFSGIRYMTPVLSHIFINIKPHSKITESFSYLVACIAILTLPKHSSRTETPRLAPDYYLHFKIQVCGIGYRALPSR